MAKIKKLKSEDYRDIVLTKKQEALKNGADYLDLNSQAVLEEVEPGVRNLPVCCRGLVAAMLEGDKFLEQPRGFSRVGTNLTIRYYLNGLDGDRKTYIGVLAEQKLAESQARFDKEMASLDNREHGETFI